MKKQAIILVNMGAPSSGDEMKTFLRKMFLDKHILPFPLFARYLLSEFITRCRYKQSWAKYVMIGGSPLKDSCRAVAEGLQHKLGGGISVVVSYSYSRPFFNEEVDRLVRQGVTDFKVVMMYPQASYSTTQSVMDDVGKARRKHKEASFAVMPEYYSSEVFVRFWAGRIDATKIERGLKNPVLLFSAHSVPQYQISKGDTYELAIHESARLIAREVGLPYKVGFQSKVGKAKWVGPDTTEVLSTTLSEGVMEILIVPVSFVTENLETLYDIDKGLVPAVKMINPDIEIHRVSLVESEAGLVEVYGHLLEKMIY